MATLSSFEELACWKACRAFRLYARELMRTFPKDEQFGLISQLRNSSRSTTHNIAEGFGRRNAMDNARFCRISSGSLSEALDQLITALDEGYITQDQMDQGRELFQAALARLDGYINYLTRGKQDNILCEPVGIYGIVETKEDPEFNISTSQPLNLEFNK